MNNGFQNMNGLYDYKSYGGALEIFRRYNCVGNTNIIFFAYNNVMPDSGAGFMAGVLGGAIGGGIYAASVAADKKKKAEAMACQVGLGPYDVLLINITENGIGMIPAFVDGFKKVIKENNVTFNFNNFIFIRNEFIGNLEVVKSSYYGKKAKLVRLYLKNGIIFDLASNIKEKYIQYQEQSMMILINMYERN